jgi:hypothetical protein
MSTTADLRPRATKPGVSLARRRNAVMRRIVGRPPLKDATAEQLARYFVPAIDHTDATDATAPRPNPSSEDPPKGSCGFTKT